MTATDIVLLSGFMLAYLPLIALLASFAFRYGYLKAEQVFDSYYEGKDHGDEA